MARVRIQTVKGQNNFWKQNAFLTCSWRFLISNKLEQLEFKLEKIIGMQEKLEKFKIFRMVCICINLSNYGSVIEIKM